MNPNSTPPEGLSGRESDERGEKAVRGVGAANGPQAGTESLDPHQRYRLDIETAIGLNAGGTGTAMVHAIRDAVLEVRDQQLRDWRRKALLRCLEISRLQGVVEGARHLLGDDISREDAWGDGYRAAQADLREILDTLNPQEQP